MRKSTYSEISHLLSGIFALFSIFPGITNSKQVFHPLLVDPYPPPTVVPTTLPDPSSLTFKQFVPIISGAGDAFEDFSYYITTMDNIYGLGQRRALAYDLTSNPIESIAILVYGCASGDNSVYLWDNNFYSLIEVKSSVEDYIRGFSNYIGSKPVYLTVAIGIDASVPPSSTHGSNWAQMINDLNNWIYQNGYQNHVYVIGAIDIETQWADPPYNVQPQNVIAWVDSYDSNTTVRAYNFGNALDCPPDQPPTEPQYQNPPSMTCHHTWTQEDIYHVSSSHSMSAIPEIYHTNDIDVDGWYRIGLYSKLKHDKLMSFDGSLTQYWACEQNRNNGQLSSDCQGANNPPNLGFMYLKNGLYDPYNRIDMSMYFKTDMIWYKGNPWCMKPGDC